MSSAPVLILMDIDGTMMRWHRGISQKIVRYVLEEGLQLSVPDDFHAQLGGKTDFQIIGESCETLGVDRSLVVSKRSAILTAITDITTSFAQRENMIAMQGVDELMQACLQEGYALGLLTGNIRATAFAKLLPTGFSHYFAEGSFGDDHEDRVELPPIALERFNAVRTSDTPHAFAQTLIIGDTDNDVRCAKAHGMPVITVATGSMTRSELEAYEPDAVLDSLADTPTIMAIIRKLCCTM
jgi:phosphoglycolate phosphatase